MGTRPTGIVVTYPRAGGAALRRPRCALGYYRSPASRAGGQKEPPKLRFWHVDRTGLLRGRGVTISVDSVLRTATILQAIRRKRTTLAFALCCSWIGAVSVHDAILVIAHHELIGQFERNPLGTWLLKLYGGEVGCSWWSNSREPQPSARCWYVCINTVQTSPCLWPSYCPAFNYCCFSIFITGEFR